MQLIKKLFGRPPDAAPGPETSQFHESEPSTDSGSRNAPRRELVQVVLRDSMRRHGIPSNWIDCRILSVDRRTAMPGMHVQLIVRDGTDRLLTYIPAFQGSFMEEIARFDPRASDWLLSVAWEFQNFKGVTTAMPDPGIWAGRALPAGTAAAAAAAPSMPAATPAPAPSAAAVAEAARRQSPPPPMAPRATAAPVAAAPAARAPAAPQSEDSEVMEDLQALFAIRDAAIRPGGDDQPDFQPTQPGLDDGSVVPDAKRPRRW
jgi:hypothetical protein